jgi:4-hydroxy-3-methylbut-2-en-1-yl diphosphate reductase
MQYTGRRFMKVNLAKSAGFCFGVKRALNIALETAKSRKKVFMLGDIVHNEEVVKQIREAGIKKIKALRCGKNSMLLIQAHGTGKEVFKKAEKLGYEIVDATCPMVKEIHRIAKAEEKRGYKIIVIGDKKHDEVVGIIGQLKNKAIVIEGPHQIPFQKLKKVTKACVVAQSTQNEDKVLKTVDALRKHIEDLKFFNTICKPTRIKQEEIKKLPLENDVIIVIGSRLSANTKRLYQLSAALNKNTHWITSKADIDLSWFKGAGSVGITAGASTPDETTREVIEYIGQSINPAGACLYP